MSTNCSIAIKNEDGSVTGIYNHWDGYLDGVGAELLKSFTTESTIKDLIMLGDCSTVVDNVEAYHRDKGEDWKGVQPRVFDDWNGLVADMGQEFNYLFENGKWYVIESYSSVGDKQLLTEALIPL